MVNKQYKWFQTKRNRAMKKNNPIAKELYTPQYKPKVVEGDIMIVPQFIMHYTEPNKTYFKKRILSFDFYELQEK